MYNFHLKWVFFVNLKYTAVMQNTSSHLLQHMITQTITLVKIYIYLWNYLVQFFGMNSNGMTRYLQYFVNLNDCQLVIRVYDGEKKPLSQ